jgi:hypothetical protein
VRAAELRALVAAAALVAPALATAQAQAAWDGLGWPLAWIASTGFTLAVLAAILFCWWLIPSRPPRPPGAER